MMHHDVYTLHPPMGSLNIALALSKSKRFSSSQYRSEQQQQKAAEHLRQDAISRPIITERTEGHHRQGPQAQLRAPTRQAPPQGHMPPSGTPQNRRA